MLEPHWPAPRRPRCIAPSEICSRWAVSQGTPCPTSRISPRSSLPRNAQARCSLDELHSGPRHCFAFRQTTTAAVLGHCYIDVVRTRLPTGSSKHNDNGKGPVLAPARGGQPLNSPPPAQLRSPNNATQVKRFFTCKLRLPNRRPAAQLATSSKAGLERTTDIFSWSSLSQAPVRLARSLIVSTN